MSPPVTAENPSDTYFRSPLGCEGIVDFKMSPEGNELWALIIVERLSWLKKSLEKLEEFKTLKPNWDSYGAKSINFDLISKTRDLLNSINMVDVPEPFLAPVSDGGVNIEWDTPNRYLSVKVRSEGVRFFGVKRDEDEKKEKGLVDLHEGLDPVLQLFNLNHAS